ncbi:MAG: bifunctional 2-polyprenyl-6-hydroxyphenol methylase/3-demethylubiquinol 3-O-methyltransferase UbiG [Hyphomicrobiales bacterium]|nr:bifunctional 2-polyprenyl-6-hydroxyphenol methylase/3-demethylubiquinol 3-O-methyltransferase UbiG [Hyphomicrobiales bacterium]
MKNTLDKKEVDRFDIIAEYWWDRDGEFKPLHKLNPTRILYIREQFIRHFGCDRTLHPPLKSLAIADIGCGGGLIAEPLTRLGARMTGIDPSAESIEAAKRHARLGHLDIEYIHATAEDVAASERKFDGVLALEVIEHASDPHAFVEVCKSLLKPGGLLIMSTLNRTAKSFALGIVAAEYLLRWLPRGTHDWSRFLTPDELEAMVTQLGLTPLDRSGATYNPITDDWSLGGDCGVNYFISASLPPSN